MSASGQYLGKPLYTQAEKQWLNREFGGEFKFLQLYQLSIYKEEDREEGGAIARTFMQRPAEEAFGLEDSTSTYR